MRGNTTHYLSPDPSLYLIFANCDPNYVIREICVSQERKYYMMFPDLSHVKILGRALCKCQVFFINFKSSTFLHIVETKLADIHKCMTRPGILYLCSMQLRKFPFNMS